MEDIPPEDNVEESSYCKKVTNSNGIDKNKFQYQAVFTSDDKNYEYKLEYRFNGRRWKNWKRGNFKPIGKRGRLTVRIQKTVNSKKNEIKSFEYQFTYRHKDDDIEIKLPIYAWDQDIPCTFIEPDSTKKAIDDTQMRLGSTDDIVTTTSSTTTSSTTTSSTTTIPECKDEDFQPYTLYDSDGNGNTVMTCNNEQDALGSGYIYSVNPKPPPPTTTTSTTTTTIPDPSSTVSQSLGSCSGPSGTRTSTLSITNNESYTAYYLIEYSTNSGSSYTTAQTNQSISGGATNTTNTVVVSDGGSIIWRYKDSRTSNDFSIASYVTLSTSDTVDCPDGYYVNVDGSNTYALNVECRKWNDTTKVRFRANPWWGDYDLAKDYMFALIALTGDYDDGDTDVEVEDYFDHSQWSCAVIPGAYFAYEKGFVQFIGQAITAPSWNSTTDVEDGFSNNRDFYVFAEQVP